MKKFVIAMMAIILVTGAVYASDKPELEKPMVPVNLLADLDEVEPNDDCASADVIAAGDTYSAAISPAGEADYFEVFAPSGGTFSFETHAGDIGDTKMYIFADDCTTELGYNDDGGVGYYSAINGFEIAAGEVVYVMVIGYGASYEGSYLLTMTEDAPPPPPPANDLCADAEVIPPGDYSIDGDTTLASPDYSPTVAGCTPYSQAAGNDVVYAICLMPGDAFNVVMACGYDASIYLVSDCADIDGSCVAGGDDPEEFTYMNETDTDQQLYLIVDAYSSGAGAFNISGHNGGNCNPVATETTTFDSLKSMYR